MKIRFFNLLLLFLNFIYFSCEKDSTSSNIGPLYFIEVMPTALNVEVDSTYQFSVIGRDVDMNVIEDLTFSWTSRYPEVGIIDQYGLFTAISSGTTFLTAKSGIVESGQVTVSVYDPVFSIEILQDSLIVFIDSTAQYTAVGKDMNGNNIKGLLFTWVTGNNNIATIDNNGVIIGKSVGTTTVTASLRDNESFPSVIKVDEKVTGTVIDIDGNTYHTIKIGSQWWMIENLKVTHYRNGDIILQVTDALEWSRLATGAYCNYNNNDNNVDMYGSLYNWYAVTDSRNIAPVGWHVPSYEEWQILTDYFGGNSVAGGKLKESGTTYWESPNTGATNESGFSVLPGGYNYGGSFGGQNYEAYFWSSSENSSYAAWNLKFCYNTSEVDYYYYGKQIGFSVRLVKD